MSNQSKWFQDLQKIKSLPRHPPTSHRRGQAMNRMPGKGSQERTAGRVSAWQQTFQWRLPTWIPREKMMSAQYVTPAGTGPVLCLTAWAAALAILCPGPGTQITGFSRSQVHTADCGANPSPHRSFYIYHCSYWMVNAVFLLVSYLCRPVQNW